MFTQQIDSSSVTARGCTQLSVPEANDGGQQSCISEVRMDFGVRWTVAYLFSNPSPVFPLLPCLCCREAILVISKTSLPISFFLGVALGGTGRRQEE